MSFKKFVLYLWQLPQNIAGWLLSLTAYEKFDFENCKVCYTKAISASVSLGNYLLLTRNDNTTLMHEYGHHKQSLMLGWLYLIVIGLPSACRNIYDRIAHKEWAHSKRIEWYYTGYPEKWADKLGHIERFV